MPELTELKTVEPEYREPAPDDDQNVWLPPNAAHAPTPEEHNPLIEKEALILTGEPLAVFTIPSGRTLRVFPKSDGQMRRINFAFIDWMDAAQRADRAIQKQRWFRFWWRYTSAKSMVEEHQKKARFFASIFEDVHVPDRHDDLPENEFATIPIDQQVAIYEAYKKANDGEPLIRAILGDKVYDAKKKYLAQVIQRAYTVS